MIKPDIINHMDAEPFESIKKGNKKMEIRLYDEKRQKIVLGQKIKLINKHDENENLIVSVIGLSRFPDFEKLFNVFGKEIKNYEKKILRRVYSKDKEKKFGVLVIHFELVNFK